MKASVVVQTVSPSTTNPPPPPGYGTRVNTLVSPSAGRASSPEARGTATGNNIARPRAAARAMSLVREITEYRQLALGSGAAAPDGGEGLGFGVVVEDRGTRRRLLPNPLISRSLPSNRGVIIGAADPGQPLHVGGACLPYPLVDAQGGGGIIAAFVEHGG